MSQLDGVGDGAVLCLAVENQAGGSASKETPTDLWRTTRNESEMIQLSASYVCMYKLMARFTSSLGACWNPEIFLTAASDQVISAKE